MRLLNTIDWGRARSAMLGAGSAVNRRSADYLAERARIRCPVDTGALLASIQVIAPSGGQVFHVVATAHYAVFVEFGSLHGGTWIPPQPFMRHALADTVRAFPALASQVRLAAPGMGNSLQHLGITMGE